MTTRKKILVASFQSLTAQSGAGMARIGYYISDQLHQKGYLSDFIIYSKGKFKTTFPSSPVSKWSRYFLFILNKLNKTFSFPPHKFRFAQEIIYDWFCASKINNTIGILLVTQPYLKKTFTKAKKLGIKIIFIPANPEENYIKQLVVDERKYLNIAGEDAYTYKKRIDFYNESMQYIDEVIGSYPTVYDSYKKSGYKGKVVEMIGHVKPDFTPVTIAPKKASDKTYIVGYLAHTVVLKGLQYLLQAWDKLNAENPDLDIKLIVAGKIDDTMVEYVTSNHARTKKIQLIGHVSDLPEFYKTLDLFIVPSLVDGGPYTALEAAHYAVPVLITENCGSSELLSRNDNGCIIIPIRNIQQIEDSILWAYNNREAAIQMGKNAKYNLENYNMQELVINIVDYLENEINMINKVNTVNSTNTIHN